jgi:hypothetical protein
MRMPTAESFRVAVDMISELGIPEARALVARNALEANESGDHARCQTWLDISKAMALLTTEIPEAGSARH